jgi:hypothetical protein
MDRTNRLRILKLVDDTERDDFFTWSKQVEGHNINPLTLLATDYMNHFNEIVMLLEMLPNTPSMLGECQAWKETSYQDHFRQSGFAAKGLAVAAYDHCPRKLKQPFEATVTKLNLLIAEMLAEIANIIAAEQPERLREYLPLQLRKLKKLTTQANAIIQGESIVLDQAEIDDLLLTRA